MSDPNDPVPPPDSPPADPPPLNSGRYGRPAQRRGAAGSDAVPRMENVRVTAPDLRAGVRAGENPFAAGHRRRRLHRAVLRRPGKTGARHDRVADGTAPYRTAGARHRRRCARTDPIEATLPGQRAMITDRNGQPMAISLNTVSLFADPRQIGDPDDAARKLKQVLPGWTWRRPRTA